MSQVSAPVVGEQFTDTSWRDLFGDEPGIVADLDGSAYKITLAPDSDVAQIGSATQNSTARIAGFSHKIPVGALEGVTLPAASGSARTDLIVVRYNPDQADPTARVRLARIAGTSAGLPAYDASPPGMEDLPLWAVTRQPGQALSQATVLDLRVRIGPALLVPASAPLPLSSPLGTIVRQGDREYVRQIDSGGVAVWASRSVVGALMSVATTNAPLGVTANLFRIPGWPTVSDRSGGALTLSAGQIVCTREGSVRVRGYADSDLPVSGYSWVDVEHITSTSSGDLIPAMSDRRTRGTSPGAGRLLQPISESPIPVKAGDRFGLRLAQENTSGAAINYNAYLTVAYI